MKIDRRHPLRVLVLHWGNRGGGPKFSLDMARALAKQDHVVLYASVSAYADNISGWRDLTDRLYIVRTYRSMLEFGTGVLRWMVSIIGFRRFLKTHQIDVVYSGMLSLWQSLALEVLVPRQVKYVSSIHDAQEHPGDESVLLAAARKSEIRRADLVVCYSSHAFHSLRAQVSKDTTLKELRLGVEAKVGEARRLPMRRPVVLGFFGRITAYKGIELFVDAVEMLRNEGLPVTGVVRGAGSVAQEVIAKSQKYIDWNIGWVDPRELDSVFASIDILVLPYTEASQSGVLTQAYGYGVPVIATPVGGLRQQVLEGGGGLVCNDVSVRSLADSLGSLARNPDLYAQLSSEALRSADGSLSWQAVAEELLSAIREVG